MVRTSLRRRRRLIVLGCGLTLVGVLAGYGLIHSQQPGGASVSIRVEVISKPLGPTYAEGAVAVLIATRDSEAQFTEVVKTSKPITRAIDPGLYEVRAALRACDGNCDRLGQRERECSTKFRASQAETVRLSASMEVGGPCTLELR